MISYATCESTIIYSSFPDSLNQSGDLKIDWRCTPTQKQILEDFGRFWGMDSDMRWHKSRQAPSIHIIHIPFPPAAWMAGQLQFLNHRQWTWKSGSQIKSATTDWREFPKLAEFLFFLATFTQCETRSESHESVERQKEWGRMIRLKTFKVNLHLLQSKITIFVGRGHIFFS